MRGPLRFFRSAPKEPPAPLPLRYKLGKKTATYSARSLRTALAMARHLDPLGTPPNASNDYVAAVDRVTGGDWGMMGNDMVGDCVIADDAHHHMLRTANTGAIEIPTTQQVLDQYSAVTGYNPADPSTDQGTNESDDDTYLMEHGFLGHKAAAQGRLEAANMNHVKWSVQLFGHVRLGIVVTQRMMDLFDAGEPWDMRRISWSEVEGGHDVPIVKYDPNYLYVVTWGKLQKLSYRGYAAICSNWVQAGAGESHVELMSDWVTSQGVTPSGLDMSTLEADLKHIIFST